MVSTRRTSASAATSSQQPPGSPPEPRGRRAQVEQGSLAVTQAPRGQPEGPDVSEVAKVEEAGVRQRRGRASTASQAQPQAQPHEAAQQDELAVQSSAQHAPAAAPVRTASQPAPEYDPWAGFGDSDDDDDEGSEEEEGQGASGQGLRGFLDSLAASITSAFQAKAGVRPEATASAPGGAASTTHASQQGAGVGTSSGHHQQARDPVDQALELHWQPEIVLPRQKASTREVLQMTVTAEKDKGLAKQFKVTPKDPKELAKQKGAKPDTAGKAWFDLPAQKIDDTMKRELRLLRLRGTFDPKRFYKSFDNTKFPKHFSMGTVIEGPQDYYSGRLEASQRRKATLTDQLLADPAVTYVRKKRYASLQEAATRHQRVKKRKTEQPRKERSKHRPKH